jgi:type I restriction enzyme R subunit
MRLIESDVEQSAITWFKSLGYDYAAGPDISPGGPSPERSSYADGALEGRLRSALTRINRHLPEETLDDVAAKVIRSASPSLEESNVSFHRWLSKGVEVQVRRDGGIRGDLARLIDLDNPDSNDWLVVNQLTVVEGKHTRRPDLVVFVNGLPIAVFELKSPGDPSATLESAWNQLQTYKSQVPCLFTHNELLLVSDGTEARLGSLTAGLDRFWPWRTIDGVELAPDAVPQLKVMILGVFEKQRLLDYLRHFIFWETENGAVKKVAAYHQFHAVRKAIGATVRASSERGDRRIGVVWHTQGSGKSVSMAFFAGKIILHPAMENPTLVVITDRNDLDGQLFAQFAAAKDLIPAPAQAESREDLRELLRVSSGGVVFSTIQKFGMPKGQRMPLLSDRRNIVVIADEAHRSHYEFVVGFAKNLRDALPHASFIGFTGTPIELDDRSTPEVFGDYIDTYTIAQSVEDRATVPLYYEARLAKIDLPDEEKPRVDEEFEEVTEGEEESAKAKLKATWARLEAMVGTPRRLQLVAEDIFAHWERRIEILDGKAMIVCMSRRICVDLYQQIVRLRPDWHSDDDNDGAIKVVMTGASSDPPPFQPHIRTSQGKKLVEKRFKDPDDPLRIVIVRDMWLTGFDVPCAHTIYLDKPMKGHNLMQAIARVNRVFGDKPAGLVVDYLGIAEQLRRAVSTFGRRRGERTSIPTEQALGGWCFLIRSTPHRKQQTVHLIPRISASHRQRV